MVEFLVFFADGSQTKIMAKDMSTAARMAQAQGEVVGVQENRGVTVAQPQGRPQLPARMQQITAMVEHVAREALAPILHEAIAPFREEMSGIRGALQESNVLKRQQVQRAGGCLSDEDWSQMEANASVVHRRQQRG